MFRNSLKVDIPWEKATTGNVVPKTTTMVLNEIFQYVLFYSYSEFTFIKITKLFMLVNYKFLNLT